MAAVTYTKANWTAQADIQELADGKYRGVVLLSRDGQEVEDEEHTVAAASDSPEEALDEAKALAHRILANLEQ
jgi:hypothetical protein